jgi:hypothetical protein
MAATMTSRRRIGFLLSLLMLAGALLGIYLLTRGPAITTRNYERIQIGMTVAEVSDLLGGPPGDYTDNAAPPVGRMVVHITQGNDYLMDFVLAEGKSDHLLFHAPGEEHPPVAGWWGSKVSIAVRLNDRGQVTAKARAIAIRVEQTRVERVLEWLGIATD